MRWTYAITSAVLMAYPALVQGQVQADARGSASGAVEVTRPSTQASGSAALDATTSARMSVAREALTRDDPGARPPSQAEITAAAEVLARGGGRADLQTVRDAAPPRRDLTASLDAVATLESRGVASAQAASTIAARLESGANDRAIAMFAGGVRSTADLGTTVGGAAAAQGALDAAAGVGGAFGGLGATTAVGASVAGSLGGILR